MGVNLIDFVGVDYMGVDFMRVDLMGGHHLETSR